jgi:hypothetical protein
MKLPVQAAAVTRGLSRLSGSRLVSAGVMPAQQRACGPGYTCCPNLGNCAHCCNNMNQACVNSMCIAN